MLLVPHCGFIFSQPLKILLDHWDIESKFKVPIHPLIHCSSSDVVVIMLKVQHWAAVDIFRIANHRIEPL